MRGIQVGSESLVFIDASPNKPLRPIRAGWLLESRHRSPRLNTTGTELVVFVINPIFQKEVPR